MSLSERLARHAGTVVSALAGFLVLGAASEASAVFDCLPKPNCQTAEQCCKKPRIELLIQAARAELRRDFYNSKQNRDDAFGKGAWDSPTALETAFKNYIANHQDADAKKIVKTKTQVQFDDVPGMTTGPDCKTTIDENGKGVTAADEPKLFDDPTSPLAKANVCKESVMAALRHEEEHQDRCEAAKAGLIKSKPATGGWARAELDESADKERDAYAREAETLRRYLRQAKLRCTSAKALAADDFKKAEDKVKALAVMRQPRSW